MINKTTLFTLQAIVVFIPASLILYFALNSGGLPDNDYWSSIADILSEDGFSTNIGDWFTRNNEHYVILPKLVYAANIVITGGNNVILGVFAWFMALLQVLLLYHLIPVNKKQQPLLFTVLLFVIAVFIFSPRQAHNWILGMSGTAWISANLFSIAAIVMLQRYAALSNKVYLWVTLGLSLCAIVTYSTSLALFPTLVIAALLLKLRFQDQILIIVLGIMVVCLYFLAYTTLPYDAPIQHSVSALVTYIFVFLGGLFTTEINYALISGVLGFVSSVVMIASLYQKKSLGGIVIAWISIQLYVCANAVMAAVARSSYGIDQAFSSRYGSLPALFWLAWIMIAVTLCMQQRLNYRKYSMIILICIGGSIIINSYRVGVQVATPLLKRAQKKSLALASIYSQAYDIKLLKAVGTPTINYTEMKKVTKIFRATGHIPFNGLYKDCPEIGSKLTHIQLADSTQYTGALDEINLLDHKVIKVKGWAYNNGVAPACIVLTNQHNEVRGIASYGLEYFDVTPEVADELSGPMGWQGYGKVYKHDKIIKVYMLTAKKFWIALQGRFQIHHQPLEFQKI